MGQLDMDSADLQRGEEIGIIRKASNIIDRLPALL